MDTGKIMDVEPMSRFFKACTLNEKKKHSDPTAYEVFKANHSCTINYRGSH